jgi:hypothetical protein
VLRRDHALADDGQIIFQCGRQAYIQVIGHKDDDWSFQISGDLLNWENEPALEHFSQAARQRIETLKPILPIALPGAPDRGLIQSLRTISLTFTPAVATLTSGRDGQNVILNLTLDNGLAISGIGALPEQHFVLGQWKKSP